MILPGASGSGINPSSKCGGDAWRGPQPTAIKQPHHLPQAIVGGNAKATTGSERRNAVNRIVG